MFGKGLRLALGVISIFIVRFQFINEFRYRIKFMVSTRITVRGRVMKRVFSLRFRLRSGINL